jgi:hypothetical protein
MSRLGWTLRPIRRTLWDGLLGGALSQALRARLRSVVLTGHSGRHFATASKHKACRECPGSAGRCARLDVTYGTVRSGGALRRRFRGKCQATIGVVPPEGAGEIRNTIWPTSTIVFRRHPRPRSLNIVDGKDARINGLEQVSRFFSRAVHLLRATVVDPC